MWMMIGVLVVAVAAAGLGAQTLVPVAYRVSRTAPGRPLGQYQFPASALTCGLARGPVSGTGLRINDPSNDALDCALAATAATDAFWAPLPVGILFTFTIAGQRADGSWTSESDPATYAVTARPGGLRVVPPGEVSLTVQGAVDRRYPFPMPDGVALDVATVYLDGLGPGFPVHIGALTLTAPTYAVRPGDRVTLSFSRVPQ